MRRIALPVATPLEQTAAVIGAVVSGLAAVALGLESVASDSFDWTRPVAPFVVSILFCFGALSRRAVVLPAAAVGLLSSIVAGFLIPENRPSIYIGVIIFAAVFATFGRRRLALSNALITGLVLISAWLWDAGPAIVVMAGGGSGITGYLIGRMRATIESERRRTEAVLDSAPVMIMEQDWSAVKAELGRLRAEGVTDLGAFIDENPELVSDLVDLVRPRSANRAALARYDVEDLEGYVRRFNGPDRAIPVVNDRSFVGYRHHLLSMWEGRPPQRLEFATYDQQGQPWWATVQWTDHPESDDLLIITAADISEIKNAQYALEEVNRSKDRFVASVSHELRTPLAAVLGFSNELVERGDGFGVNDTRDMLTTIRDQAQEAAYLIEDLLVAARADMGHVTVSHEPIDLISVVSAVQRSLHTDITVVADAAAHVVCGDALRVRQIVRNLITNTLRYGGADRRITIESKADSVALEVRDDGTSLSDADVDRIFEPYWSAHGRDGRTDSIGLGLSVSRVLCEVMGGTLDGSVDPEGTSFRLELPRHDRCAQRPRVGLQRPA